MNGVLVFFVFGGLSPRCGFKISYFVFLNLDSCNMQMSFMKHEKCKVINDVTLHHKLSISRFSNENRAKFVQS